MTDIINSDILTKYLDDEISRYWNIEPSCANSNQIYRALSAVIRNILIDKRNLFKKSFQKENHKQVYYICMEFLTGKLLKNNILNLKIESELKKALQKYNVSLEELYSIEKDPGLGNGGLGRLAACFMDSLATLNYPATGYSIKYEFGLFKQKIIDGWQTELPDDWLTSSDVWLIPRIEERVIVKFEGQIQEEWNSDGLKIHHINPTEIEAIPYDMLISGYDSNGVSLLRLWESRSLHSIDMNLFSQGDYIRASAGYAYVVSGLSSIPGHPLVQWVIAINLLAGITGSASGGLAIGMETLTPHFINTVHPEALHRLASIASGGLDGMPHNGAVVTTISVSGLTHKTAYWPIFVCQVLNPILVSIISVIMAIAIY
jgi:hypothetical protein